MAGPTRLELATSGVTGQCDPLALQPGESIMLKIVLNGSLNGLNWRLWRPDSSASTWSP